MANRIRRKLIQQISERIGDVGPGLNSMSAVRREDEFAMRLYTNNLTLAKEVNKLSKDNIEGIDGVEVKQAGVYRNIKFHIDRQHAIVNVIEECLNPTAEFNQRPQRVVVEFSSPNMAKPFHMGHFRSTIIGNFIANVNSYLGENVTKLNYLGDWGTQFGMLKLGMEISNVTPEQMRNNPLETMYQAYVKINKFALTDNSINIKARQIFNDLENGDQTLIDEWNTYRKITAEEMKITYQRLGVSFDDYHWESMYNTRLIKHIVEELERKNIVKTDTDGKKVATVNDKDVVITKSDGSSLYLSRDIAAALDRFGRYSFDQMFYVVDNSQTGHFKSLFNILSQMESPIVSKCQHVKFGRITGMSTRKGETIFLKDILDEAMIRMCERRLSSITTKGKLDDESVADVLGTTSVIIYDLRRRRNRDYDFTWDKALQDIRESGSRLQYTHCRLHSIEQNCDVALPTECDPSIMESPHSLALIKTLARFDDVVRESRDEMEACILVVYLFELCNRTNKAISELRVKGQAKHIAEQRLLLFHCARLTLKRGLEILGINPLTQM